MSCVSGIATRWTNQDDRVAEGPLLGDETTAASQPSEDLQQPRLSDRARPVGTPRPLRMSAWGLKPGALSLPERGRCPVLLCQDAADDAVAPERIPDALGGHKNFHLPVLLNDPPADIGGRLATARLGKRPKHPLLRVLYLNE